MNALFLFFADNMGDIGLRLLEHVRIVGVALLLAIPFGITVGIALSRGWARTIRGPVFYLLGLGQTIPSLALLALAVGLLGVGLVPAVIALLLYSILPIARNCYTGIQSMS
ncbi:MAG: ABC transporter permease, partial [Bacteroidota bacterium]